MLTQQNTKTKLAVQRKRSPEFDRASPAWAMRRCQFAVGQVNAAD